MRMVEGRYADLAKMGRPKAEKPKSSKISIRFTDEEFEQLKQRADQNDQTITETIRAVSYTHLTLPTTERV